MVSVALRVPSGFKYLIDKLPWVNWSELAREEVNEHDKRVALLDELEELCKGSKLTDEDCLRLGREVNKRISRRFKEL